MGFRSGERSHHWQLPALERLRQVGSPITCVFPHHFLVRAGRASDRMCALPPSFWDVASLTQQPSAPSLPGARPFSAPVLPPSWFSAPPPHYCRCAETFANYLSHARVGALLARVGDEAFDAKVLQRAKVYGTQYLHFAHPLCTICPSGQVAIEKRGTWVPRTRHFIRMPVMCRIMEARILF